MFASDRRESNVSAFSFTLQRKQKERVFLKDSLAYLPAKRKACSHILSLSLKFDIVDTPEKFEAPEIVRVRFLPLYGICHVVGSSTDILSSESNDS